MTTTSLRVLAAATAGLSLLASCDSSSSKKESTDTRAADASAASPAGLAPGHWDGWVRAQNKAIHFEFDVAVENGKPVVYLINKGLGGAERLRCDEITSAGDSTTIRLHVFDAALVMRPDGADKLAGTWVKYDAKTPYRVPVVALHGQRPMPVAQPNTPNYTGTWRATFTEADGNTYPAVGIFKQDGGAITGTFLTTTGDYRYLSGAVLPSGLGLSTFDGNHGFLFQATKQPNGTLKGDFYSGKAGHETWTAVLDPKAKLPDADTLTYMKKGESQLNFKFPSIFEGGVVDPSAPKYRGKVVVIQLLGSWCPNCMDETAYLAPWYDKNKSRGVEVIGLGYERSPDYKVASARLRNLRDRYHINYELAVAGVSNKDSAAKSLPQLAKVLAFPTTIFLDKKGNVRKIHTGFAGPGTGKYYQEEIAGFNREVDKLLKE
ncbi:TlpA disulfide reductase family protein [Hymenobacter sp. BT770]|uniref:TlpA disulfide reductase family protein n=1 Tax=Hymenobacter sp. BT770 TaxID=2886942 RepID=UPI001D0FB2F9|nr:TlpA disulfide reductase family protein [Hymenobacter sp. BT770]MCC3152150.1 TlpA family protein disulfide reductase [Hymenobacter sp. BT770]MDO3415168.1 TlpA disulfide reductase family protein [Hymenobacter sp. BT770]